MSPAGTSTRATPWASCSSTGDRQRPQHRHLPKQPDVVGPHPHGPVDLGEPPPPEQAGDRRDHTDRHQGAGDAEHRDQEGCQQRPGTEGERTQALEDPEHPGQDAVGRHPGDERERRDVDQGVADADHAAGEERHDEGRDEAHQRQGQPPQDDRDTEPTRHRPTADKESAHQAAGQRTDPDRALQHADTRLVTLEEIDRDDDDEDTLKAPRIITCSSTKPMTTTTPASALTAANATRPIATVNAHSAVKAAPNDRSARTRAPLRRKRTFIDRPSRIALACSSELR